MITLIIAGLVLFFRNEFRSFLARFHSGKGFGIEVVLVEDPDTKRRLGEAQRTAQQANEQGQPDLAKYAIFYAFEVIRRIMPRGAFMALNYLVTGIWMRAPSPLMRRSVF